jgi:nucleoside-diphosphate-sugar epimerase
LEQGEGVVSFDLSEDRQRLNQLLSQEEQAAVTFVTGDLTDYQQVLAAVEEHGVTRIIHLAALQVPFCIANPVQGARVNVTGTVNVFEAARRSGIGHIAYASSIAVYGPPERYPPGLVAHQAAHDPRTLYGVYKVANEGTARVYWRDWEVSSTGLRPYTVYGVGRDQGLTSEPTKALRAAVDGEPYHISFGGTMQFQLASDVARQFILAAREEPSGAQVFNLGTEPVTVEHFAEIARSLRPAGPRSSIWAPSR